MAKTYGEDAIEFCRKLYCKYGGKNHDAIQVEMRKAGWAGWQKSNLHDRGKAGTKNERLGWITKFGFERSLQIYTEGLVSGIRSDEQDLYIGIRNVRQTLQKKVEAGTATKDEFYQYRDFCKLEIEARKNLDLSRDNLETFVAGYEKLIDWVGKKDPQAAKMLVKHGEYLAEMAQIHYGKAEAGDHGAGDREDEGGDRPGPGQSVE